MFKPIASDLGLSRAATSVVTGVRTLQTGVVFPIAGWLSDKFGPKWVIISGICITGTGFVLMNYINSAWAYYVVWGAIMGIGHSLGLTVAIDTMLTNWFVSKRGRAFSVKFAIIGLISVIVLPIIGLLVTTQGWRTTSLIWAGLMFASIPPALYFVRQKRPEYYGLLPDGAKIEPGIETDRDAMIAKGVEYAVGFQESEFTLSQALRTSSFWMLTIAWIVHGIVIRGFRIHCIPFLTDMGIGPITAASMMAMMILFTIPARIFGGLIADRIKKEHLKFLLAMPFFFIAAGIIAFLLSQNIAGSYVFLILYGCGSGAFVPLDIIIRSRYFGRKAYGSIQGASVIFSTPISFLAPVYTGWVYDSTGSYIIAFILFVALATFAAFLMLLIRVPKPPDTIGKFR